MQSIFRVRLLSVLVSCAISLEAIAQQLPSSPTNAQPNKSRIAASAKSWESPTLRISLPTTATKFKFSQDGEMLLTNGSNEQSAELWNLTTGKQISALKAKSGFALCDVALSPNGQFAAALTYSLAAPMPTKRQVEVNVWNLKTKRSQWTISIQSHAIQTTETPVCNVEFSPNNRVLATSISSRSNKSQIGVRIWDVGRGRLQQVTRSAVTYIERIAFSPDSSTLGFITQVNGKSQLHLWNLSSQRLQAKLQAVDGKNLMSIIDIVFSPNRPEAIAFTYDGGIFSYIYRWQIKTGKLQGSSELPIDRTDSLLALSPDGQTYVYGGDVTGYHIGNYQTSNSREFPQGLSPKSGQKVVFSPDGQQMAIARDNKTIDIIR